MRIAYDPKLLEEVVFGEARGNPALMDEYRRAVEPLYEQSGEREAAYARVHLGLFEKWGFGDRLRDALREFPELEEKLQTISLFRTASIKDERADLTGDVKGVGLRIMPSRFLDPHGMKRFLRHELTHISDMLDEGFGYRNERVGRSPGEEYSIISRYGVLWDIYIDGRLTRLGRETERGKMERLQEFSLAFPILSHTQKLSGAERIWGGVGLTHDDLLSMAKEPAKVLGAGAEVPPELKGVRIPGSPCPLCRFPAHDWGDLSDRGDGDRLMGLIREDFPQWQHDDGICWRCLELYDLKVGVW
ncbi:MAG: hypothetical protein V3S82_00690 [Dehalococcoidia bacterium]